MQQMRMCRRCRTKPEFQIIDDSDPQSGANRILQQAGMDGTQGRECIRFRRTGRKSYVVVKCEDDERYTFLYEEQSTDSKKKLKRASITR